MYRGAWLAGLAGVAVAGWLLWLIGDPLFAGVFLIVFVVMGALLATLVRRREPIVEAAHGIDIALIAAAIEDPEVAIAITDRDGRLVCANRSFGLRFPGYPAPPGLPLSAEAGEALAAAAHSAWRDGRAESKADGRLDVAITRAGLAEDHLIWRIRKVESDDAIDRVLRLVSGIGGERLASAGVMAALVDGEGRLIAANRVFAQRALGNGDADLSGLDFVELLQTGSDDELRLAAESDAFNPIRLIQIPLGDEARAGGALFLLLDEEGGLRAGGGSAAIHQVHALLAMLPLGLALVERDGRFLLMNGAFERAAGLGPGAAVLYPGDLVVKEDKAVVADTIRRFAAGHRTSGDIAVRLAHRPDEPVVLTVYAARGLGEAAVLLGLKDSSEENRLKHQVAQATKMQAVGQLAGGVAHDFNNILTAILGHCDLMMMRHAPGDSDYDDIQQIKHNSNRAAGLTRQLLAFSRQQTLRPQLLQLPDVISEISNLLKRLLGETVTLTVKHGRNLGPVRADPGQLEQVIVNLAVNARDAMPGGGALTLQTYAVSATEVGHLRSDILPVADYTALRVSDTGTGMAPDLLTKIFEPFFTTKEIGKGTGLGLSTVYGIVKQTGGFIFADSKLGQGTSFTIYLPVHHAEKPIEPVVQPSRTRQTELWGSGTILLVEDEDMVRAVAERALNRQGYHVLTAANGEEALEILVRGEAIDLLVSDVVMPTMDGPTLVKRARAQFPELPILFMSGYAEEQLRRSIDLDRIAFLPKPFSVQQLAEAVRDAMAVKRP